MVRAAIALKPVLTILIIIAALCGLWIIAVELSDRDRGPSQGAPVANPAGLLTPVPPVSAVPSGSPSRSASSAPAPGVRVSGAKPADAAASNIARLRLAAGRHKVDIVSLREISGGVQVKFRARDHIATGDLLDELTRGGLVRDFDQGPIGTETARDGSRRFLSEFKLYW